MKKIFLSIIVILFLTTSVFAAENKISGIISTVRQDNIVAKSENLTCATFYNVGTNAVAIPKQVIENQNTNMHEFDFIIKNVPSGNYDLLISKIGYLPYIIKNVTILDSYSEIVFPKIELIPGDFDDNYVIDLKDLTILLRSFDNTQAFDYLRKTTDLNEDTFVTVSDLGILKTKKSIGKTLAKDSVLNFSYDFIKKVVSKPAYYLIDDYSFSTRQAGEDGLQSGWNFDNRGGIPKLKAGAPYLLNDVSTDFGCALIRHLTKQIDGKLRLEAKITISAGTNGFELEFFDSNAKNVYKLFTENGKFNLLINGKIEPLNLNVERGSYFFLIELDLNNKIANTFINFKDFGTYPLTDGFSDIENMRIGTSENGLIYVIPAFAKLYANYSINEQFNEQLTGNAPFMWDVSNLNGATTLINSGETHMNAGANSKASATKSFEPQFGNVCLEMLFLQSNISNGFKASLLNGKDSVVDFYSENGKFYSNFQEMRNYYLSNMWYILRIEADTTMQKAIIKINGKILGEVPFKTKSHSIDTLTIEFSPSTNSTLKYDNVYLQVLPEYSDYVPKPIPSLSNNNYIGINICSLWRNGDHYGWDNISAYDELKPLLGFYDEGIPEVADWEIKWMVEHGIDFQCFCWYSSQQNAPIKTTGLSSALHGGFMNAKYSDMMSFALLWEAANAAHPAGSDAFRNYFVPYWKEYFFSDDRYMKIDNKLVMAVFGAYQLVQDFGSAAGVKAEFDYLRSEAVKMGFDGMIILACGGPDETIRACGFDGVYAYNWGKSGDSFEYTKSAIESQTNKNLVHVVPTISTGFNNVGWGGDRSPNMSISDYQKSWEWVKNIQLPKYNGNVDGWKSKLAMISTWNEYGEGTYVMPSGLNEFGYLDVLRNVFTDSAPHNDKKPTENQIKRLGYLYPANRTNIRPLGYYKLSDATQSQMQNIYTWNFVENNAISNKWYYANMKVPTISGNAIRSTTNGSDPIIGVRSAVNINIDDVDFIKVRMSAPIGDYFQIFYTTDINSNLDEKKSFSRTIDANTMKDYYINTSTDANWKGTLKTFRIDPVVGTNTTFSIESITLSKDLSKVKIYVNSCQLPEKYPAYLDNGHYMMPFYPDNMSFSYFNAYHEWDREQGKLTLYANHKKIEFFMDSYQIKVDGFARNLNCTPKLTDGLPSLPLDILCEILGYTFIKSGTDINITTPWAPYFGVINDRIPNEWEFNLLGDSEGWSAGAMYLDLTVSGKMGGVSTPVSYGYDPIFYSPDIDIMPKEYSKVVVSMKHSIYNNKGGSLIMFYLTDGASSWTEANKLIATPSVLKTSGDNYLTYEIDLSSLNSKIKKIRIDPFDAYGEFYIDYIKFVK